MRKYLLISALLFIPSSSYASVTMSEIAWMGTMTNANDEWIELYNSGSDSVDVEGWTVTNAEATILITLHGTIQGGGYALLERTDDDTVPGVSALVMYTGALSNTGTTLILKRSDGSTEDQVFGGADWSTIGGDNATKQTPQRTGSSWVTGVPTPGGVNVTQNQSTDTANTTVVTTDTNTTTVSYGSGGGSLKKSTKQTKSMSKVSPVLPTLSIAGPQLVYVNQSNVYEARVDGLEKTTSASLLYTWNFGDSNTREGKKPTHTYTYPGEYVVVVRGVFGKHDLTARTIVRVLPITLHITRTSAGDIRIVNTADHEIDISNFTLTGEKSFTFPENSILLEQGVVTVPKARVGGLTHVVLHDTERVILGTTLGGTGAPQMASVDGSSTTPPLSPPHGLVYAAPPASTVSKEALVQIDEKETGTMTDILPTQPTIPLYANTAAVGASGLGGDMPSKLPYLGLVGVMCAGVLALYLRKPTK